MRTAVIQNNSLLNSGRIDPSYHLSESIKLKKQLLGSPYTLTTVGEKSEDVFLGNIFTRVFVKDAEHGVPYIAASDMTKSSVDSGKFVSKKQAKRLKRLMLDSDWILISCSGTLGNVVYTNDLFKNTFATHDLIRLIPDNKKLLSGFLYAYLASKYGYTLLTQSGFGGVVKHINSEHVANIPVPLFPESKQQEIHNLIVESANLRVEANRLLEEAKSKLLSYAALPQLTANNYDYFGARSEGRTASCFTKSIKNIDTTTINAFNHSSRIEKTKQQIRDCCQTIPLEKILNDRKIFSTGSFPRVEVNSENGIMLINQKDIFDTIIKGKKISRRKVKTDSLVEYGEVLIAGVGTLGESETFCRAIFANEDLQGQLVSGEFIRMKTNEKYLSGYLFAWLNSDYGFRLIRNTQAGTKLCRPIPRLFLQIPVPILEEAQMIEIDQIVKKTHTLYHLANVKENQAISLVEKEIESWQQS
ncbi:Type I restriction modification DNA specificity domain protein [anaerobic digester metagenome]|uniref:methylation-associated defense system restriction endonuclease subunit S MAD5 n=1 Tax=Petrimonas sp. TaxID=2023866 RepID=UPI0030CABDDC